MKLYARTALALVVSAFAVMSQTSTSQMGGTVTDSSGAQVPEAIVTLTNEDTGIAQKQLTTVAGLFTFPSIPAGTYTVRVEAPGFKVTEKRGNIVQVNTPLEVSFRLQVGEATETVNVSESAESLQTSSAVLGNVVDRKAIVTLPLNGRNPLNLLIYEPGVTQRSGSGVSVNGSRGSAVNVTIDGIEANESSNPSPTNNIFRLNPDSVQEFKVTTSNPTPEEGRNSGANVSIATRSGTNQVHGTMYEFFRNTNLNSKEFFANAQGLDKQEIKLNQYGFEVGGPIRRNRTFFFFNWSGQQVNVRDVINSANLYTPAALNGDFRYFVVDPRSPFVLNGQTITQTTPALIDQRTGALAPGVRNCASPTDANCVATFNIFANDPLHAGMDPKVKAILGGYPAPNTFSSSTSDGLNLGNYTWATPYRFRGPVFTIRVDHTINAKHTLWGRWLRVKYDTLGGDPANSRQQILPGYPPQGEVYRPANNAAIGLRSVLTPRLVNEFTLGYSRFVFWFTQGESNPNFPSYRIASFNNSSTDYTINPHSARALNVPQIIDNLTYVAGAHVVRVGGNIRMYQHNDQRGDVGAAANSLVPQISLSRSVRAPAGYVFPAASTGTTPGIAANDLTRLQGAVNDLLGVPASLTQIFLGDLRSDTFLPFRSGTGVTSWAQGQRLKQSNLFAQDEWKIRPNLTASYGVRWEINSPPSEAGDRVYRPDRSIDGKDGPVTFVKADRWYDNWNLRALAPRFSLAWVPGNASKMVIRAGYGMAFDPIASFQVTSIASSVPGQSYRCVSQISTTGSITTTPGCAAVKDVRVGQGFLDELPPPSVQPSSFLSPPAQLQGVAPPVRVFDPNLKLPTTHMWNLTIQRELGGFVVSAGYVGRRGTRLLRTWDMNQIDAGPILPSFTAMQTNFNLGGGCRPDGTLASGARCSGAVAVPMIDQGIINAAFANAANTQTELRQNGAGSFAGRVEQTTLAAHLRRNQQFSQILYLDNGADSVYHGGQFTFRRRFDKQGLLLNGAYTLSKAIDDLSTDPVGSTVDGGQTSTGARTPVDGRNYRNERGRADFDQRHVFNMSGIYELPLGKGKKFGNSLPGALRMVVGDWSVNGIYTFQSGEPFTVRSGVFTENSAATSRAALKPGVGLPSTALQEIAGVVGPVVFPNADAFTFPAPGQLGIGRNIFQNPSYWNLDVGIAKGFPITERYRLTFRTEMFNALNHANFRANSLSITGTTFGQTCCSTMSTASSASTVSGESWRVIQFALKLTF